MRGLRHKIVECRDCPDDEKKKYLGTHREDIKSKCGESKYKASKRVDRDTAFSGGETNFTFTCIFAKHTRDYLTAEIGSDANLMDETPLNLIVQHGAGLTVTTLPKPPTFEVAVHIAANSKPVKILRSKIAIMAVELHIRHGKTILLRNIQWVVTSQRCSESLLSRPVPEAIGINELDILCRSTDRLRGDVDVVDLTSRTLRTPPAYHELLRKGVPFQRRSR